MAGSTMGRNRLQEEYRALTGQADALTAEPVDEEALRIDLLLKYKERCKKDARNYAQVGELLLQFQVHVGLHLHLCQAK